MSAKTFFDSLDEPTTPIHKTKQVSIWLPMADFRVLRWAATQQGVAMTEIVLASIRRDLAKLRAEQTGGEPC